MASWLTEFASGALSVLRRPSEALQRRPAAVVEPANQLDTVASYMIGRPVAPVDFDRRRMVDEGYRKNVVIYVCINEIASTAAGPQLKLRTRAGDEIETHPFLDLMARPNAGQGRYELTETTLIHLLSSGDAYWHKGRRGAGDVIQLKSLRPTRLQPIPDAKGNITGYEYTLESSARGEVIPAADIVPFKFFDPLNDYHGLPPAAVCAIFGDIDTEAALYMRDFFLNGAMPAGLLKFKVPRIKEGERDRIWQEWQDQFGRPDAGSSRRLSRWHSIGVIGADVDYQSIAVEPTSLKLDAVWGMSETRICAAFGVPPQVVAMRIGMQFSTYSNYESAQRAFWLETLVPMYQRLGDVLTRHLVSEWGDDLVCYFDVEQIPALQENETERQTRIRDTYRSGLRTLNESRRLLGEDKMETDYIVIPKEALPVKTAMDLSLPVPLRPGEKPPGQSPPPGADEEPDEEPDEGEEDEGEEGEEEEDRAAMDVEIMNPSTPPSGAEEMVARGAATFDRAFRALVEETRRAVDQGALETALRAGTRDGAEAAIPFALFEARYAEELQRHLVEAATRAMQLHRRHHGGSRLERHALDDFSKRVADKILSRVKTETRRLGRDLRDVVRSEILQVIRGEKAAVDAGRVVGVIGLNEHQAKAVKNLRARLAKQGSTAKQVDKATARYQRKLLVERARRIAEHETRIAEKLGQSAAWDRIFKERRIKRADYNKMWLTAEDERVCPICEPLDRMEVPLGALFDEEWEAPPDPHLSCRCRVVLVRKER